METVKQYQEVLIPAEYTNCNRDINAIVLMIIDDRAHLHIKENFRCSDCDCMSSSTSIKIKDLKNSNHT
jgi:hypothetical protein